MPRRVSWSLGLGAGAAQHESLPDGSLPCELVQRLGGPLPPRRFPALLWVRGKDRRSADEAPGGRASRSLRFSISAAPCCPEPPGGPKVTVSAVPGTFAPTSCGALGKLARECQNRQKSRGVLGPEVTLDF